MNRQDSRTDLRRGKLKKLTYFNNEVMSNLLNKRKEIILTSIRDAEYRYQNAKEKLKEAKIRLEKTKLKANEIRNQGLIQVENEKFELIQTADQDSKRLEESKNITIGLEEQRTIKQVRKEVSKLALHKTLIILEARLTSQLQVQMIDYNIDSFFKI
jgi:F0F1-type ATP synthase membrane subunit b/b'